MNNLIRAFLRDSTSYLSAAMATDVELYEATQQGGKSSGSPTPDHTEVDLKTSLLMGIHELLQQNVHFTAQQCQKGTKKPKIERLPRPVTAKSLLEKKRTREAYEHINNALVFVDSDEFERITKQGR